MIVPQFWAEARVHQPRSKSQPQITVRRFGWSDVSQVEAEALADQRAHAAFQQIASGAKLARREPKAAYNGAEGVPIREETLERHGDVVITRNAYGAHCLNTPDVLFADIDFAESMRVRGRVIAVTAAALGAGAIAAGVWLNSGKIAFLLVFLSFAGAYPLVALVNKIVLGLRGGAERIARARIAAFVARHPDWNIRLYRTPAGFRLLVMHAVFDARAPEVAACFAAFGVDPVYAAMCRNQCCFRARVSPKPWRIGIGRHLRPRPGVWPVKPEHVEMRRSWIRAYEAAAVRFASCRFVEAIGAKTLHPKAEAVRALHDRLAQAFSGQEIA